MHTQLSVSGVTFYRFFAQPALNRSSIQHAVFHALHRQCVFFVYFIYPELMSIFLC